MYCWKCGKENSDQARFCAQCGSRLAAAPKKEEASAVKKPGKGLKIYSVVMTAAAVCLAAALAVSSFGPALPGTTKKAGKKVTFDTPEDAIRHFADALAANDADGVFEACAVEETGDYQFAKAVEDLGAYTFNMSWPGKYPFYQKLNSIKTENEIAGQLKSVFWTLNFPDLSPYDAIGKGMGLVEDTKDFERMLDPKVVSNLKIVEISDYTKNPKEAVRKNNNRMAGYYNAEEQTERSVLYELDDQYYAGGFTLIQTENGWKVKNMTAVFLGLGLDGLAPVTEEEYGELVKNAKRMWSGE